MAGQKTQVREQTNDRKYFTMIPNIVLESNLSPVALALYVHLKRIAGDGGACEEGLRALETETGISRSKISQCRAELEAAGLIEICASAPAVNAPQVIMVLDVWRKNTEHFAVHAGEIPCPPHGHEPAPCPPHGHQRPPYGHACPPHGHSTYSEKTNKNREEGNSAQAPAIVATISPAADVANSVDTQSPLCEAPLHLRTQPSPRHRRPAWMGLSERDKRLTTYEVLTGWKLNKLQEDDICARVKPDDPAWESCIRQRMRFGCSIKRAGDAVDDYLDGGPVDFRAVNAPPALRNLPPAKKDNGRKIVDWQELTDGSMKPVYAESGASVAQEVPA